MVLETEAATAVQPGSNGSVFVAQNLGLLATSANNSDENLRLGFVVKGNLGQTQDQDVYSFSAVPGTEVWLDIDQTTYTLDTVVELLDANGIIVARSDDSGVETLNPSSIVKRSITPESVNSLNKQVFLSPRRNADGTLKEDGTTNPRDAGMRVVLPGASTSRSNYFVRVRSKSRDADNAGEGLTVGSYRLQVRIRESQEFPGSTVQYADIRYATNGVHLRGIPYNSPLLGEESETEGLLSGQQFSSDPDSTRANVDGNDLNRVPFSYVDNMYTDEIFSNTGAATGQFRERSSSPQNPILFPPVGTGSIAAPGATQPVDTGIRPQHVGNILASNLGGVSVAGELASQSFFSSGDIDFYRFTLREEDVAGATGQTISLAFDIDYADGLNRPNTSLAVYRLVNRSIDPFFGTERIVNRFGDPTPGAEQWQLVYVGEDSNIADDRTLNNSANAVVEFSTVPSGRKIRSSTRHSCNRANTWWRSPIRHKSRRSCSIRIPFSSLLRDAFRSSGFKSFRFRPSARVM